MARPTKFSPEITEQLCTMIRAGNYMETAAAYVGISRITVRNWMKRGARQKTGQYREFLNAIKKAMAHAEMTDVALIGKAATENWQAAAWRLERKYFKRWGRKDKLFSEVSGPDGKAIEIKAFNYGDAITVIAPQPVDDSKRLITGEGNRYG